MTERSKNAISIGLIVIVGLAMSLWTWGRWADPVFGSGRELYVPWQLSAGKVLYRDVAHANGPLSPYFNALLFSIFSPRVCVLEFANFILLAIFVAMVWRLWKLIADTFTATVACILMLLLFSFVQFSNVGGFNFALPSEHEMTHGLILCFAAITCLAQYIRRRGGTGWIFAAGVALGLIALTKSTMFIPAIIPVVLSLSTALYSHRASVRIWRRDLLLLIAPVVVIPIIACAILATAMPWRDALSGLLDNWRWWWSDQFVLMHHTQAWLGVDRSNINISRILLTLVGYALLLIPATIGGALARKSKEERAVLTCGAVILVLSLIYIDYDRIQWQYDATAGLTLVMFGLAVGMTTMLLHRHRDRIDDVLIVRITLVWTALLMVVQLGLRAVIFEYGFVLALPATLIGVAATLHWLPRIVERAGGFGGVPRAAALAGFAVLCFNYLHTYQDSLRPRSQTIGNGLDALHFDVRGGVVRDALAELQSRAAPSQTLMSIPDGALLNFLSHRANPTPFVTLMPVETLKVGPERVLESIENSPPDWIVINNASVEAFDSHSFAEGYGRAIWEWIAPRYEAQATIDLPDEPNRFSMRLYRRRQSK